MSKKLVFMKTKIKDLYLIEPTINKDFRGSFSRMFCSKEYFDMGIEFDLKRLDIAARIGR